MKSPVVRRGDVDGEGIVSPLGKRGLDNRRGDCGAGPLLPGDRCRWGEGDIPGKMRLLRFLSLTLAARPKPPLSEDGDSVRFAPATTEDGRLLSLSPASLSASKEPRFEGWEWPSRPVTLLRERGVGHSMGLLDRVEVVTEDGRLSERDVRAGSDVFRSAMAIAELLLDSDVVDGGGFGGWWIGTGWDLSEVSPC